MAVPNDVVTGELITAATMNAILAELRKMPQSGTGSVSVGASTDPASVAVVFPRSFDTVPNVNVTQRAGNGLFYAAWPSAITTTGFTLNAQKAGTSGATSIPADWSAQETTS